MHLVPVGSHLAAIPYQANIKQVGERDDFVLCKECAIVPVSKPITRTIVQGMSLLSRLRLAHSMAIKHQQYSLHVQTHRLQ